MTRTAEMNPVSKSDNTILVAKTTFNLESIRIFQDIEEFNIRLVRLAFH